LHIRVAQQPFSQQRENHSRGVFEANVCRSKL
jgi:hypothetical protein